MDGRYKIVEHAETARHKYIRTPRVYFPSAVLTLVISRPLFTMLAVTLLALSTAVSAHSSHQTPLAGPHQSLWYNTLPGDGGTQVYQF